MPRDRSASQAGKTYDKGSRTDVRTNLDKSVRKGGWNRFKISVENIHIPYLDDRQCAQ